VRFRDLQFGPDDAKGDTRLTQYFLRIPEYERVRSGSAAFVIGRKGTGKTAICQMIYDEAQNNPNLFAILLSFKNAPTSDLFASSDASYKAPSQYISIWKFLIALEASKLALRDESIPGATRSALDKFLRDNFGSTDVVSLDAVSTLKKRSWRVGLTLPIHHMPGAEVAREDLDSSIHPIHYGRAATALLAHLATLRSDNEFFLLFDDLADDYRKDRVYFDLLISLLKAVYEVRHEMDGRLRLLPIVVLREDIHAQLDDHDLNKLRELTVRLRWNTEPSRRNEFSLRGLINERVRANIEGEAGDFWSRVVDENSWTGPENSMWHFLVNRTMDRPRDLIVALKLCQPFEPGEKLSADAVLRGQEECSEWLYREVADEIFRELPEYRDALGLLTRIGAARFRFNAWRSEFGKDETLLSKYGPEHGPEQVLEVLFNFSVVGMSRGRQLILKYRTPHITFDKGASFEVHRGLRPHLVIPGRRSGRTG